MNVFADLSAKPQDQVLDTTIGQYLSQRRKLSQEQIDQVLRFQQQHGLREQPGPCPTR